MPMQEQRLRAVEDKLVELDTRTRIGAHNLDDLTNRVEAVSESLARLEGRIADFLTFWEGFLRFLRHAIVWTLGIVSTMIGGFLVWYLTTHVFH